MMTNLPVSTIQYKDRTIDILRLDKAFPLLQGNKYFKLKYNLEEARNKNFNTLLTFGGAFSNHIHAVAIAGKEYGFKTIGLIRGEDDESNPTLQAARELGMDVHFISRLAYQHKNTLGILQALKNGSGEFYVLPEGGTNALAVKGCTEIMNGIEENYDLVFCAVGTGGTLAGIISTPNLKTNIIGISSLKGEDMLTESIRNLIDQDIAIEWKINYQYHFGGYARFDDELMRFILQFTDEYKILPDPVYTAKVFYGVCNMIDKGEISSDKKILAVHSGGLQGWDGWQYRFGERMKHLGMDPEFYRAQI